MTHVKPGRTASCAVVYGPSFVNGLLAVVGRDGWDLADTASRATLPTG